MVWQNLALQNGVSNYGSGYQTAQFAVKDDCVLLRGLINIPNGTASGTVIANVPLVPLSKQFFAVIEGNSIIGQIDVDTAGNVIFQGFPTVAVQYMGLNNIWWSLR